MTKEEQLIAALRNMRDAIDFAKDPLNFSPQPNEGEWSDERLLSRMDKEGATRPEDETLGAWTTAAAFWERAAKRLAAELAAVIAAAEKAYGASR